MSEVTRLVDQLERAQHGEAWHGPSLSEVLEGVTHDMAAARPLRQAHSIWEIVRHVTVWEDAVRRRLLDEHVNVTPDQDWSVVTDPSAPAWRATLAALEAGHAALKKVVAAHKDEQLDQTPLNSRSTRYVLIQGAIQHDLYHAGQIAVLRKS